MIAGQQGGRIAIRSLPQEHTLRIISIGYINDEDVPGFLPVARFRIEEALIDPEGNQLCPICACCSLVAAESGPRLSSRVFFDLPKWMH